MALKIAATRAITNPTIQPATFCEVRIAPSATPIPTTPLVAHAHEGRLQWRALSSLWQHWGVRRRRARRIPVARAGNLGDRLSTTLVGDACDLRRRRRGPNIVLLGVVPACPSPYGGRMLETETATSDRDASPARVALTKVPEITLIFWVLKLLTTGMGEAMSDFLGQHSVPIAAAIGIFGLWFALRLQLRQREYRAPIYWFAVMMVAIFGTMAADGIHDGASIPYTVTTPLFAIAVAAIFYLWHRSEGTLSIHSITTRRRESYYWVAVLATFALGTAAGDLTALSLHLGFWASVVLFAAVISIPAVGWWRFEMHPIVAFWFAYIVTRPLGASFADGFSKHSNGGLGLGDGLVSGLALIVFVGLVAYVAVTKVDVQDARRSAHPHLYPQPHVELAPELD
jgi:uncharacterized membrane-anchored protein